LKLFNPGGWKKIILKIPNTNIIFIDNLIALWNTENSNLLQNMFNRKNAPLIIGFSIPVLMILFVAISIYVPGIFLHPKFNFLYSGDGNYNNEQTYTVNDGHLTLDHQMNPYPNNKPYPSPSLYIHNVVTNESKPISFRDAQNLNLDSNIESPDGYKIEDGNPSDGFFPFFWYDNRNENAKYIVGHNVSKKLNITINGSNYYYSFRFLGWINK